jgi:uncharacterized protein (DUF111 family)
MNITKNLGGVVFSVILSCIVSSAFAYNIALHAIKSDRQFRVVDVKQLSEALMRQLETTIKEQDVQMKPELIEVIAQNEAKKLFTAIANTGGKNDIILPKSSVIYAPERYELTKEIAEQMGLKGIEHKDLKKVLGQSIETKD